MRFDRKRRAPARVLSALLLCAGLALPAGAASFTDVKAGSSYEESVQNVVDAGLMSGTSATTFSPTGSVTRAMAVTTLWRLAGSPAPKGTDSFSDVPEGTWYTQAVAWAQENGIASGNGKGAFQPGSAVTREQMAVFLYQYARYAGHDLANGVLELYSDQGSISKWARTAMEHAVGAGLITGSKGKLSPKATTTRAELAVMLERMTTPVMG